MAFVAAECANHCQRSPTANVGCRGIGRRTWEGLLISEADGDAFRDAAVQFTCPLPFCLIGRGLPCVYFELAVLPIARKREGLAGVEAAYERRTGGDFEFRLRSVPDVDLKRLMGLHPFLRHDSSPASQLRAIRAARTCSCGEARAPGKRYCPVCREKRRKAAYRRSKRKIRRSVSTVGENGALRSKGL
jgi:hypothetical protein